MLCIVYDKVMKFGFSMNDINESLENLIEIIGSHVIYEPLLMIHFMSIILMCTLMFYLNPIMIKKFNQHAHQLFWLTSIMLFKYSMMFDIEFEEYFANYIRKIQFYS